MALSNPGASRSRGSSRLGSVEEETAPGPIRTCIGCRLKTTPGDLVRIVASSDPDVLFVVGRTLPGRGAWLCADRETPTEWLTEGLTEGLTETRNEAPKPSCVAAAVKRKAFARAFRSR